MADKITQIQEGAVLVDLVASDGWGVLENLIQTQIKNDIGQLTQQATKDIETIRFLQGRIDGNRQLIQKVQDRIKAYRKG